MKKTLTEEQLRNIVLTSVKRVLREINEERPKFPKRFPQYNNEEPNTTTVSNRPKFPKLHPQYPVNNEETGFEDDMEPEVIDDEQEQEELEDDRLAKKMEIMINMLMGMFGAACLKDEGMCHNFKNINLERYIYIDYEKIDLDQLKQLAKNLTDQNLNSQGYVDGSQIEAFFDYNLRWDMDDIRLLCRLISNAIRKAFEKALSDMPQIDFIGERFDTCSFSVATHQNGNEYYFTAWIDIRESENRKMERRQKEINND